MGEELALRGFALPRLQERHSPFDSGLIIGIVGVSLHLPVLVGRDALSGSTLAFMLMGVVAGVLA